MLVEVWSDVVCPWCYIGKRRFEAALRRFEHADEVEVRWRSFELDPSAPMRRSRTMAEQIAHKYAISTEQAAQRIEHLNQMAAAEGLDLDMGRTVGGNTFAAHRLAHFAMDDDPAFGAEIEEALFSAYFSELRPIGDRDVLLDVATRVGLDGDEAAAVLDSDRYGDEVRSDEAQAAALGCTGVPFFVIERAWAVPGAQDSDTFLAVLRRAWEKLGPGTAVAADAPACVDDACDV
ncbi:MAG: DsbA family oxidoreductase [Acidimicrobiales bacterium]